EREPISRGEVIRGIRPVERRTRTEANYGLPSLPLSQSVEGVSGRREDVDSVAGESGRRPDAAAAWGGGPKGARVFRVKLRHGNHPSSVGVAVAEMPSVWNVHIEFIEQQRAALIVDLRVEDRAAEVHAREVHRPTGDHAAVVDREGEQLVVRRKSVRG